MADDADAADDADEDARDSLADLAVSVRDRLNAQQTGSQTEEESTPGPEIDTELESLADETEAPPEGASAQTPIDSGSTRDETATKGARSTTSVDRLDVAGDNVLVLGPLRGSGPEKTCIELLECQVPDRDTVLFISVTRDVQDTLELLQHNVEGPPGKVGLVQVGSQEGQATETSVRMSGNEYDVDVTGLSDTSDLPRLGIMISRRLDELPEGAGQTVVCLHSLTDFLQYVDTQRLFRFMHVLLGKFASADAVTHVHMDPESHDTQTVNLFSTLFDTIAEVERDGSIGVRRVD